MNQIAKDCAAKTEHRIGAQEAYNEVYERERNEYMANPDWDDVSRQCPDEVPVLMGMIAKGAFGSAKLFLFNILRKAADSHADVCATNATEPSTW